MFRIRSEKWIDYLDWSIWWTLLIGWTAGCWKIGALYSFAASSVFIRDILIVGCCCMQFLTNNLSMLTGNSQICCFCLWGLQWYLSVNSQFCLWGLQLYLCLYSPFHFSYAIITKARIIICYLCWAPMIADWTACVCDNEQFYMLRENLFQLWLYGFKTQAFCKTYSFISLLPSGLRSSIVELLQ